MNALQKITFAATLMLLGNAAVAEAPLKLPPVMYYSTLEDSLFDTLKSNPVFSQIDKELYGSPLRLGVIHTFAPTAGGTATGLTSAVLAGGSLGILPIVSNNDLVVTYTLSAHGKVLATFNYSKNFTQATNIYSNQGINHLDKPTTEWVNSTVTLFIADLVKNPDVRELTDEYNFYFGSIK